MELSGDVNYLADEELGADDADSLKENLTKLNNQASGLTRDINELYSSCFRDVVVKRRTPNEDGSLGNEEVLTFKDVSEASFGELGRRSPAILSALLAEKERVDAPGWQAFQSQVAMLKLKKTRLEREIEEASTLLGESERQNASRKNLAALRASEAAASSAARGRGEGSEGGVNVQGTRIVLITGFESFNVELYKRAAEVLRSRAPGVQLRVFSDRDIATQKERIEAALSNADVLFCSLLFDFDQVEWLRSKIRNIPIRLVFESALELMSCTSIGSFNMLPSPEGKSQGPPPIVKKVLSLFGSKKEEDKMVGYLSFLKVGPQLLKFIPGDKARDLKNWLSIYSYWNQGGLTNVISMFLLLLDAYKLQSDVALPEPVVETPPLGCLHPSYRGGRGFFSSPAEYMKWYEKEGPLRGTGAPIAAIILYRKHVITELPYINQLVTLLEAEGLIPLPIFINGVESHVIVRDLLTTDHEQKQLAMGITGGFGAPSSTLKKKEAARVDAIISTIGFPLVGGPAGSMEGGRQADVAKEILASKNVPYFIAAPLLIQDMASWLRDGIAGLQSVVLYSLPELDGAIDTVPLGGLVGDGIFLVPERVRKLGRRVKRWVELRKKPVDQRKVAVLCYGFPPGVGATGTAALLNVPKSLEALFSSMSKGGYTFSSPQDHEIKKVDLGEGLVSALKLQEDQRVISGGREGVARCGSGSVASYGWRPEGADVSPKELKDALSYPPDWGPTEWGPIPFLPDNDILVQRMEKQWGDLRSYRGLLTSPAGSLASGLVSGNVFLGVQPPLGIEGDPMRLLFERDLTPHPQYAAFYKWLQEGFKADVIVHMGMHGTVEWLPGAPLGNTGLSWSDVLLGELPNVYVYAANNPSESIIAKRRGYGTIVSYNVPPYGRAGLYKQLISLREYLAEYKEATSSSAAASRQSTEGAASSSSHHDLKEMIINTLSATGLQKDCPYTGKVAGSELDVSDADNLDDGEFKAYVDQLYVYLQEVESRLFSEGLHVLGKGPDTQQMAQYLDAYFGDRLIPGAGKTIAEFGDEGTASLLARIARLGPSTIPTDNLRASVEEALEIRLLLSKNTEEIDSVLKGLAGEYILPEAGGDLLRDGKGVLPTGRNIHALDPYRMPSSSARERGAQVAAAILETHQAANEGAYPETVAVNLWGLDAIKTKGESVGIVLHMVGARPVQEGTGRVVRFDLVPLSEMGGRPRIDCLCNMSGIFRDSFQNVVELLDDLFQRAAAADEPIELNFIKKHSTSMKDQGIENTAARLFSNPAGDYGSMVNERVGAANWESGSELGDTWASRNSFSYGRGGERGKARPEVLQSLLSTTERIVQEVDSVEYGLTDIQEYYANTGALKRAAEGARKGGKVGCSIVEAYGKDVKPRELEEVLRLEYRSKLLNPKWANAMANQGSGGAYEISQRMTAMVGWGATVDFKEDWSWDQSAEMYALDPEMRDKLKKSNPQAYTNMLKRMLEAQGRGMWNAKPEVVAKLRELFEEMDDQLEGI